MSPGAKPDNRPVPFRSAENLFLDAAIYTRDGDFEQAIAAARSGIAILTDVESLDA